MLSIIYRILESHWFTWVTQTNHIPMEIDYDKQRDWPAMQVRNRYCECTHNASI